MKILHVLAAALLVGAASAQEVATATATVEVQKPAFVTKELYPLETCVVSGKPLAGDRVQTFEAGGRTFKTCCPGCVDKVKADPAAFAAKLDEAIVAHQLPVYPLDVCAVSGKKLGSMGDPVRIVVDGTLVQLCCKGCTKRATADAVAITQRIRQAAFDAQLASYPLKDCGIAEHELGEKSVSVMLGTTLVRVCCTDCIEELMASPHQHVAAVRKARGLGGCCGTECVQSATGAGCCADGAAKTGAAAGTTTPGCCSTPPAGAPAKPGCCESGGTPAPAPAKTEPAKTEPAKK